jgi:chromosome segregation ATPase
MSRSVDRESLERQKQDILQENSQLRLMLEDSIPKCLYHRLEQQLTETVASASVHGASMRDLQLDNQRLLTRLNTLEQEDAESCSKIQSLQKELKQSQEALFSARKYVIGQEEEAKKIRESLEEKSAIALRTLQEQMKAMEVRCLRAEESLKAYHPETNMKLKFEELAKQVVHLRASLGSMKVEFLNLKRSIANAVFRDVEKIIAFHQRTIKLVAHDINCIMAESGVLENEGMPHVGLSETLDGMRSLIVRVSRDWRNARTTAEHLIGEVEALKQSVSEKDSIIDGLALRLSNFDRAKRTERASLARLRNSIESAERKLNASRLQD